MIQDNLKYLFEFIEEWLNVACAHDVKRYEYVVKSKWKNPHADWRVLEWMIRRTRFVNSMPLMSGPPADNKINPQECFNNALDTVVDLNTTSKTNKYSDL